MIDSISPYVTQILVSGRRVAVGTVGESFTLFDKPMTPAEIQHAIYTKVNYMLLLVTDCQLFVYILVYKIVSFHDFFFRSNLSI